MIIHTLPINDIMEHEESTTCKCEPKLIYYGDNIQVIHMAFDGRHVLEEARQMVNPQCPLCSSFDVKQYEKQHERTKEDLIYIECNSCKETVFTLKRNPKEE